MTACSQVPLVVMLLVVFGCASDAHRTPASWPTTPGAAATVPTSTTAEGDTQRSPACGDGARGAPTGVLERTMTLSDRKRSYLLVVPPTYSPRTAYPVVYVLHGHGGSAAKVRSSFDLESYAKGAAIFVYPEGGAGWDLDSPASKNGDVALFDASLASTQSTHCVDLRRVFVTGISNGAYMANQLGCRRGDRIRAVATHAGGGPYENDGRYDERGNLVCSQKPVASLVVHGLADATVKPSEGQKSVDHWTHANHCASTPTRSSPNCVSYGDCQNPVTSCKVPSLGHALWPDGRQLTWTFFDALK